MLTWKDVLFSSDLVALLERSKTAERRENSSSAPYKGLLWAQTPASHHFLLHWAITQLGEHIRNPNLHHLVYTFTETHIHMQKVVSCGAQSVRFKRTPSLAYTLFHMNVKRCFCCGRITFCSAKHIQTRHRGGKSLRKLAQLIYLSTVLNYM